MLPSSDRFRHLPLLLALLAVGGLALLSLLWLRVSATPHDPGSLTAVTVPELERTDAADEEVAGEAAGDPDDEEGVKGKRRSGLI